MAKTSKQQKPRARKARNAVTPPIPEARFPATVDHKITCAKHIIQAVVAAHDSDALDGENYDIHWPLSLAIELLEQAWLQVSS